jgi:hypothetical protein
MRFGVGKKLFQEALKLGQSAFMFLCCNFELAVGRTNELQVPELHCELLKVRIVAHLRFCGKF